MAKGMELPVNVLVIIVIAVIVLIALVALVAMGILTLEPVNAWLAQGRACSLWKCGEFGQTPAGITVTGVSEVTNLGQLCDKYGPCTDANDLEGVKKYCGCATLPVAP
jgi:hypothetical protein